MKAGFVRLLLVLLAGTGALLCTQTTTGGRELPQKYRDWLDLTSYIILPAEREVFNKLESDRDRDIFIQSFWKQRDPTPGTPQNEFMDEHLNRFAYANTKLKRSTPREGWRTDMGRIHIILGPPASIERFDSQPGVQPCQVWYYRGEARTGLPPLFALVFYQRGGSGEYKLYNPASDGPASLLVRPEEVDQTNFEAVYAKIRELTPSLAPVVLSVIPGEFPSNFMPSPRNSIIMAQILESPRKNVNPRYATDFLLFKGIVSTEYLTNYVESDAVVAVLPDPGLGIRLLHLSLSPKKVSVDHYQAKDEYYCNFKLNATLKKGGEIVFQHEKDFPFYFPPDRKSTIEANGVAIEDFFPVAEGQYELAVLVQNSVGKEFCFFERTIDVPPAAATGLQLSDVVVGYRREASAGGSRLPFEALDRRILVDAGGTLSRSDELTLLFVMTGVSEDLWREGKARIRIEGLKGEGASEREFISPLSYRPFARTMVFDWGIAAKDLGPDYYEIGLTIVDGTGSVLAERASRAILSDLDVVSHPVTLVRGSPPSMDHVLFYGLAYQYDKLDVRDLAEAYYARAVALNPGYGRGIAEQARFLVKIGKFDQGLDAIERIKDDESLRFQYHLTKGLSYMGKGDLDRAIASLLEGNRIYNSDVQLLNALGNCYYRTGRKKEALDALTASYRLNQEQKDVKSLIDKITGELKSM
jgi:GWxTD domain-containing protein